ncbi:MAG TPA: CPBP family intramembrane glutamic endopeptidase [Hyphomicrobiaceae bacterium]|nr:CPBP family intramembrane glutamic endopeptidase [Hyphomicrobiaceae bacterium]
MEQFRESVGLPSSLGESHRGTTTEAQAPPRGDLLSGPPAYQARTPWGAGAALAVTIAIVVASTLGAMLLLELFPARQVPGPGAEIRGLGLIQILAVALTLGACFLRHGRLRDTLALHPVVGGWRSYLLAILAMACLQLLISGVQFAFVKNDMLADLRPFAGYVRGPDSLLAAVVLGLGAPFSEELLFRGFLLGALAQTRLGFWGAAVISAALWTTLHYYTWIGLIEVFVIGLFLSWLLWRTGSLRVTIFCHALYNSMIVLALRFMDLPAA